MKPYFRVIVPCYNCVAYLPKLLDSMLSQDFDEWKCVIVDDWSDDMTFELAQSYQRRFPDRFLVLRPNAKAYPGGCRNIGMRQDFGSEYDLFADADDYFYSKDAFSRIHEGIRENGDPDVLLLEYCHDKDGKLTKYEFPEFNKRAENLAQTSWTAAWTKAVKTSFDEPFLPDCARAEDAYHMLKLMDKDPKVAHLRGCVYVYRMHDGNVTKKQVFKDHSPRYIAALETLRKVCRLEWVRKSIDRRLGK